MKINKKIFDNGLRLVHNEDTSTQMVALNIVYDVGARDEHPEHTGFAHLFEHLMFGGSVHIPDYDAPLQLAGGENNAWTNNDITNYYLTVPKSNVEIGFWLESDRMLELAFSEQSLEVQRAVVMEEFKQRCLNQPYGDVGHLLRPLAYQTHPYRWPTIGKDLSHIANATLDEVKEHMEYMARMKWVFDEVFDKTEFRVNAYPSTPTQMGLVFCDELGMLYIDDRTGGRGKMPELIRYDQIASYEEYLDETPAKEPGQESTLNGGGLKLKLVQPRSITEAQTQRGMHPHPYIKQELVICFSKRDRREIGYAHIARQHLDHIFGVHDNETSLFGRRMSKAEERELKGQVGMISAMGAVASAAMKGGQLSEQEKARFVENINLANDAQTGGMAVYSRRADEAFAKVQ